MLKIKIKHQVYYKLNKQTFSLLINILLVIINHFILSKLVLENFPNGNEADTAAYTSWHKKRDCVQISIGKYIIEWCLIQYLYAIFAIKLFLTV